MINPTEAQEAHVLVQYLRMKGYRFHHSPNETGGSAEARRRAIRVKREGTSKGFPDYQIWTTDGTEIFIELKRIAGSRTTEEQKEWVDFLNSVGSPARICKGAEESIAFIESFEKQSKSNKEF